MTSTPSPTSKEKPAEDTDSVWSVVVYNDPVNLMSYVTYVFEKVFQYPRDKAERHMWEVHQTGKSLLWGGTLEQAELYTQKLHAHLLFAQLEKAS